VQKLKFNYKQRKHTEVFRTRPFLKGEELVRMTWEGHPACTMEMRNAYINPKVREIWGYLLDGRTWSERTAIVQGSVSGQLL
jgi:hypothetical protein